MPRGRHRQSSALLRIAVLSAALAPALIAVLLAVTDSGGGISRAAVGCALVSTLGVLALLRQSRRGYGKDLAQQRRERDRLAETAAEERTAHEQTRLQAAEQERELATARGETAALRAQLAKAEARAKEQETRAGIQTARARDLQTRVDGLAVRAGELAARADVLALRAERYEARLAALDPEPARLTRELFALGAAALANLERGVAPTAPAAQPEAPVAAAEPPTPVAVEQPDATPAPAAPLAPAAQAPVAPPVAPRIPGVRRRPISVEGLVPAYAASLFGPQAPGDAVPIAPRLQLPAAQFLRQRPVETPMEPAGELLSVQRAAELAAQEPEIEPVPDLDLGIDALEPAVAALPADDAVARTLRDVADTVRATEQRMSQAQEAGSFDFFGHALPAVPELPALEAVLPVADPEPVPAAETPAETPVEERPARAGREVGPRFETAVFEPPRPLITHEPRTGRAIPVDLTAHDDTEQLPMIVDTRKHA